MSSAAQPPYSTFAKLNSGTLNNVSGVSISADTGVADLQIFTREGIQLSGKPLTQQQVDNLINKTNGFAEDAVYTANYTSIGTDNKYIGAEITRLTTAGAQTKTITAIGFSENLNLYAANSFPTSRAGMSSAMSITTAAGRTSDFTTSQGMMAGQIAAKFNNENGKFGVEAKAYNNLELFGISNGRLQFDLLWR